MTFYDVAIVGAGPAGAAAAIAARRAGATVLLLDRADFPRDKPCGDGIAPDTLDEVAALGVSGMADGFRPNEGLRLVGPGGDTVVRRLKRAAYTIPRRVFDARLVEAAVAAGADLQRHSVRAVTDHGDRVTLDGYEAAVVIGADGAGSTVRRALGHRPNADGHMALAIRGYAPVAGAEQILVTTTARWPAYAWSFAIGDGTANVGYGEVLRDEPLSKAYLLARMTALLPGVEPIDVRAHHLPLSTSRPSPGSGRILLVGDAMSLINPFTGEGIFYAVVSGGLAGAAAAAGPEKVAARYTDALRRRLGRHLRHSGFATRLVRQPRVLDAAVRAAGTDRRVFDRMADLGLGDGLLDLRTIGRITGSLLSGRPRAT